MRFLLYFLAALFALPLVVMALLWARSYHVSDDISVDVAHRDGAAWRYAQHGLFSGRGRLVYYHRTWLAHRAAESAPRPLWRVNHVAAAEVKSVFQGASQGGDKAGFMLIDEVWGEIGAGAVIVPAWAVTGVCAAASIPFFVLARRAKLVAYRRRNGLCIKCGYDMRESRERCPECGWAIKKFVGLNATAHAPSP